MLTNAQCPVEDAYAAAGIYLYNGAIMTDDKTNRGPQDRSRISLTEGYEIEYWTEALGVSEARLREVVGQVGPGAEAVREALAKT